MIDGNNGSGSGSGGGANTAGILLFPVPAKYESEEFIIPSADQKGHSEKFWFRAPGGLDRQMQIYLASRRFPYKTSSDVMRHALVRHLRWLGTLEGDVPSVMSQVQIVLDVCREENYHQEFNDVFTTVGATVSRYLSGGHNGEALRTVARCKDAFEGMPEGFWREQYLGELMKRFGYLFEGDGVGLAVTAEGDSDNDSDNDD